MNKVFIASGYNSWTNKPSSRAFSTEQEANSFINELTDPRIHTITYNTVIDLTNYLLTTQHEAKQ